MDIMVKKLGINCISSLVDLHRLRCHVAFVWMWMNMNRVMQAFRVFCSQMRMDRLSLRDLSNNSPTKPQVQVLRGFGM
jgi:hypothetical protein